MYENHSSFWTAKESAQHNLAGLSHFVSDDTLRFFKSRIVFTHADHTGQFLIIVETKPVSHREDKKRGYYYAVFDSAGKIIGRNLPNDPIKRKETAIAMAWRVIDKHVKS